MGYPRDLDEHTDNELLNELSDRAVKRNYGRCDYCNRLQDEGDPCKFPERHRHALTLAEVKATGT